MTDQEYAAGERAFKIRIGQARGRLRKAPTMAAKVEALKKIKDLETDQRRYRANRFAGGCA